MSKKPSNIVQLREKFNYLIESHTQKITDQQIASYLNISPPALSSIINGNAQRLPGQLPLHHIRACLVLFGLAASQGKVFKDYPIEDFIKIIKIIPKLPSSWATE